MEPKRQRIASTLGGSPPNRTYITLSPPASQVTQCPAASGLPLRLLAAPDYSNRHVTPTYADQQAEYRKRHYTILQERVGVRQPVVQPSPFAPLPATPLPFAKHTREPPLPVMAQPASSSIRERPVTGTSTASRQAEPQRPAVPLGLRREQLGRLPVQQVRALLQKAGLSSEGKRATLVERLVSHEYRGCAVPRRASSPQQLTQPASPPRPTAQWPAPTPLLSSQGLSIRERLEQLRIKLISEEATVLERLRTAPVCTRHMSPFYRIVDVLATMVTRQGQQRDCTLQLSPEQRGYEVHIAPLDFDFQPDVWMERVMDVYMPVGLNDVFPIMEFPKNWRRKNPLVELFRSYLTLNLTFALNAERQEQHLTVQFSQTDVHVWEGIIGVFLLEPLSAEHLVEVVQARSATPVIAALEPADTVDAVAVSAETVSLRCPLTLRPIACPAKGRRCLHAGCFDLEMYLQLCAQQSVWNCPLCNQPCPFEELLVDPRVGAVLESEELTARPDVTEVYLHTDGTFTCKDPPPECSGDESEADGEIH